MRLKNEDLKSQGKLVSSMKSSLKRTINLKRKLEVLKSSFLKKSEIFSFTRQYLEKSDLEFGKTKNWKLDS